MNGKRLKIGLSMTTSQYICAMTVNGEIRKINATSIAPIMNAMKVIGGNMTQIVKKANKINRKVE